MKAATVHEIKTELMNLPAGELSELCLRLAKFKKENKELLTYLLFEANDEQAYINNVKAEIDEGFDSINLTTIYFAKKTLRRLLRVTNKYIRYTGAKQVEAELLIHYCSKLKNSTIPIPNYPVLMNLYQSQLKKIRDVVATMHEDLQYDYQKEIEKLFID